MYSFLASTMTCLIPIFMGSMSFMIGSDRTIHILSSGKQRKALLHLPPIPSIATKVPLVVNLHTLAESAEQEAKLTGMSDLADIEGFIVVYPDGLLPGNVEPWLPLGIGFSWNGGTCCPKACSEKVADVQFMRDLVTYVKEHVGNLTGGILEVDTKRVFGSGASNGAFMMNRVGCEAPELFAAIAPVAGPIGNGTSIVWGSDSYSCPIPKRPLPTIYFHGTSDPLVPWGGNPLLGFPSIPSYISLRKSLNGISDTDNGTVTFQNHSVECTSYGSQASNVTFCKHPSGHCWPGREVQGPCTKDIDATTQIWSFFKRITKKNVD